MAKSQKVNLASQVKKLEKKAADRKVINALKAKKASLQKQLSK
jgi:hypothetical protein